MGRLIIEQIVSADGSAQDADGGMNHVPSTVDDGGCDVDQRARLADVEAVVLGANTYRLFSGHWPQVTEDQDLLASILNTRPKHVVSNSLTEAPWGAFAPATVERGDGVATIRRLKAHYSGEIVLWGSLTLAAGLFDAGEVDVLRLRIVPTLAGGRRTFTTPDLGVRRLELVESRAYSGGQIVVKYALPQ
ncbi:MULTISPECIES: dihydrofolate reductase family protein [Actinoalloteichus]|uniref:Dihydrofolate reductase n=1 Tax=Actinoalloteichus fjordicus TaxID=1612552 RepID=A0AAC9LFJ6_9PSEU|nr:MULTISPECIES: dihydrofolate reductase family protein [Actinoalloteichus]APU16692.1 dihydrofolate reductase [Actinoalloteichus fjordicus]APU22758.1 dihydrofolate reductase [Actinoalloteichus sp. GBA129-24]